MEWQEVIDCPYLKDLPFKIELNEYGSIVMTPASNRHAMQQGEIYYLLRTLIPHGRPLPECSVATSRGVKVADVAWMGEALLDTQGISTPLHVAPEICVEIISPSNSWRELEEKRQLYFEAGAHEVWVCHEDGRMEFFAPSGSLEKSGMVPQFPLQID